MSVSEQPLSARVLDPEGRPVVVAVYEPDGKLFNLVVQERGVYVVLDVDWCERDEHYYFHESSSNGAQVPSVASMVSERSRVWVAPGVEIDCDRERVLELDLPDLFDGDTVFCTTCEDRLPCDDPCDHVAWCDEHGEWKGQVHEPCGCEMEESES